MARGNRHCAWKLHLLLESETDDGELVDAAELWGDGERSGAARPQRQEPPGAAGRRARSRGGDVSAA